MSEVKEAVRSHYADAARKIASGTDCGCGCGGSYAAEELAPLRLSEAASLGCGNPTVLARLEPGQVVLDLGSGAGLDVLLSARRVAPGGHAYGVDMTDEMLEVANRNEEAAGVTNATFLKGTIEDVPLPDGSVDVVISNCVINLAEDKARVIKEAYRVLRPGGRFAVADIVEIEPLGPAVKREVESWAACISGAITIDKYRAALLGAGFENPEFDVPSIQSLGEGQGKVGNAYIRARKPAS